MSTKATRRAAAAATPSTPATETPRSGVSTPGTSKSARSSPLSPTRISRLQEKADLQNLNDRLAAYIDRVRQLETENNRLQLQVETIQESVQKEVVSMKGLYDQELTDTRKLLDQTARDRAQSQIENGKLKAENEELKIKLARKERDLNAVEKALEKAESLVDDLTTKFNAADGERKKLQTELKDLRDESSRLNRQLSDAKKQLEGETLMRVDMENRCQSLREEMQFKEQVFEKEVQETKSRRQVEISEIDGKLQEEYESKMQEGLQELRDQYEQQMSANRGEMESIYEGKIEELTRRLNRGMNDADSLNNQLKDSRSRTAELTSRISLLESTNSSLQNRVNDLESQLDSERESHRAEILLLKEELERLRDQMETQLQEYQDLMDIKIALDMEIAAYRKLLEAEEARLHLTPGVKGGETPGRWTPMRPLKRKRGLLEEDITTKSAFKSTSRATGELEIVEECPDGKFIRIENKGSKDFSIGSYQLIRKTSNNEVSYKFHRQLKVPANAIITVWSSDAQQTHDAPFTLVMKNQKWPVADEINTVLTNTDSEEIASRESKREQESFSSSVHYGGYGAKRTTYGSPSSQEKCSLM